ncbi:hypothetical protein K3495_g15458 [Podosphaera aphanis]|nr:hypothetical protein K3495_g15458 [Podosphaera aphanis]
MSEDCRDNLWTVMTNLRALRELTIRGITSFTANGILAHVDALHATNKGLKISLKVQEESKAVTDEESSIFEK